TSRGGTTEAATSVWSQRGVPEAIVDAVLAAASRAAELGRAH
ncbi:MAG: pyrroline-5-carboxylate reductase, partial [Phycisphaerae bacterium]|nr:pyrroline-5-carboxylate reductase [Phycisphaerae bacterium]